MSYVVCSSACLRDGFVHEMKVRFSSCSVCLFSGVRFSEKMWGLVRLPVCGVKLLTNGSIANFTDSVLKSPP